MGTPEMILLFLALLFGSMILGSVLANSTQRQAIKRYKELEEEIKKNTKKEE